MCAILDTNRIGDFKKLKEDMQPVWQWLEKRNGKIVYSDVEKIKTEWDKGGGYELRRDLIRRDKLKQIPIEDVEERENQLKGKVRSDDEHVIALALTAQVNVLISSDKALIRDFKKHVTKGKVYKTKQHERLLTKDTCP